ncbi:cytochrome P450 [Streptomyces coacervatus]|uniref:Cytochrome P450 n=1 Tax=Streptomyces coacervatus TaxID=647381 RepID=A0ABP7HPX4_9ACTN
MFDKGGPFFERARELIGDGLVVCPHRLHRQQRRVLQPAFHRNRMPGYMADTAERVAQGTAGWQDGHPADITDDLQAISTRILVSAMFSSTLPQPLFTQIAQDATTVMSMVAQRMLIPTSWRWIRPPGDRRYRQAHARLQESLQKIVTDGRTTDTAQDDLLTMLLKARQSPAGGHPSARSEEGMSDQEIFNQLMTFLLAGSETTAGTMAWALYELALQPDLQQQVHNEIDTVLGGQPVTHRHLADLKLLGRVISETLRLHAPAWLITRTATTDTTLGRHRIPAGATVAYSAYTLHHRADLYPNPERFDPDRWLPSRGTPPSGAYLPFAQSARKCIGDVFATTEATLVLAAILTQWQFHPDPTQPRPPKPPIGAISKAPITLRPTRRGS